MNGRSYPDTVTPGPLHTQSADGTNHFSQPLPAIINIPAGKRALLRITAKLAADWQLWVTCDWVQPAAGQPMSAMPPIATEMVSR